MALNVGLTTSGAQMYIHPMVYVENMMDTAYEYHTVSMEVRSEHSNT